MIIPKETPTKSVIRENLIASHSYDLECLIEQKGELKEGKVKLVNQFDLEKERAVLATQNTDFI